MRQEVIEGFRLSPQQKRLWVLQSGEVAYRSRCAVLIEGKLGVEHLKEAARRVVNRHEILRTSFGQPAGVKLPVQVIAESATVAWRDIFLNHLSAAEQEAGVEAHYGEEGLLPFDLEHGSPVRFSLLYLSETRHILFITLPSLCADAASLKNLFREISRAYGDCLEGSEESAEEVVQYVQFSEWQRELLESPEAEEGRGYWRSLSLSKASAPTLPLETASASDAFRPASLTLPAGEGLKAMTDESCARHDVSADIFLQTCWQTLLRRLTGQTEIVLHISGENRVYEEMRDALGLYAKWLPVVCRFEDDWSFAEILKQVGEAVLSAHEWQEYFSWEQATQGGTGAAAPSPAVAFEYVQWPEEQRAGDACFSVLRQETCTDRFKLKLSCVSKGDSLSFEFQYDPVLYTEDSVRLLAGQFTALLTSVARNPEAAVGAIEVLGESERRQLLDDWNNTTREFDAGACLHELFEAQVERTPGASAVVFNKTTFTYRELNERANRVAHRLMGLGVGREARVALCMERSAEMIVALLGILKAGAAYVPLDISQPKTRLAFMLQDARASVLLTQEKMRAELPESEARVVCLDTEWDTLAQESEANPRVDLSPRNLCYVIYTSGSTGSPKGVMIEHASVVNLSEALAEAVYDEPVRPRRVSLNAPLFFDSSVKQVVQLLHGHTLHVVPEEMRRDGQELLGYLSRHEIDVLDCTPSQLWLLVEAGLAEGRSRFPSRLLLGGEALDESMWKLLAENRLLTCYNVYGPTECTVDATACRLSAGLELPVIGRPLANIQAYVLDEQLRPAPIGVPGELHIGGAGLARGYLDRGELTAEKFVPNPFSREGGARLYKTGDLARYMPDGNIEFLGRIDYQVKIRGSRIELGEIETVLAQHAEVRRSVVVVWEDARGDKRLVAYVVARQNHAPKGNELRSFLQERLPDYMIPAAFVMLEALPLTRNGKVDRRALPEPEQTRTQTENTFVAPRNAVEERMAEIWEQLLGVEQVGVNDNFFDLGGHSLLATQAVSQVRKVFQIELPLRTLFESPTVAGLAPSVEQAITGKGGNNGTRAGQTIERVSRDERLPLSYAQQRLWFLDLLESESTAYNIPAAVRLSGALNLAALEYSLGEVVRRHELLRTTFAVVEGQPVQIIAPPAALKLSVQDLGHLPLTEREEEMRRVLDEEASRAFDLGNGPLIRARLLRMNDEEHVLVFMLHHIVFDAWSIEVLLREVAALYRAFTAGRPSPLAELPVQYADFARWQREWLQGEVLEKQIAYWRRQLEGVTVLELPSDRPRPPFQSFKGAHLSFMLPDALTRALDELSRREGVTMFMTLLAAFQTLLARYTSQEDVAVGTPIANRNRSEIEGLIGFFINTLVMRTDMSGDPTFGELLKRVREMALDAYAHQDVPFEKLVEELQPERNLSRTPFFQIMFALRSVPQEAFKLPELTINTLPIENRTAKFDLLLMIDETAQGLRAEFEYNTDLFDEATVRRMGEHFQKLLESIVAAPGERLSRLPLLTEPERRKLLVGWNDTRRETPETQSIQQLFEEQAERTPDAVAVVFEDEEVTYRELNRRANQLAHYLREMGVGPDVFVAILMHRSVEMMASVLGVLKAGGAYAPLEPSYPQERLAHMLEDTRATVVLTQAHLASLLPGHDAQVVILDAGLEVVSGRSTENPPRAATPENLAYVTYTSGSTGKPKGIAMPQRALLNLLDWQFKETVLPAGARTLQFAALSFDVSFQDMFSTWGMGGALVLITDDERRDIAGLAHVLAEKRIQRLFIPAVALQQLAEGFCAEGEFSAPLRKIIAGSEQLQITRAVARFFTELDACSLHNEYGPSETHVVTELALPGEPSAWPERPSVGRPIYNAQIYILDAQMQPVPVGIPGELYIGGAGLARCYLNRPDLTAERFVPDLFGVERGARLYRTGDLARRLANGEIEFLGRMDFQVKIRGFRVELGEVEVVLSAHPSVRETIVLAREDVPGNKRLVAYVVAEKERHLSTGELRGFLQEKLPDYMIPSVFVFLDALPLNSNGKVNRRALPVPDQSRPELELDYVAPRNAVEGVLAAQWAELLGIERVGVDDNFFSLGGHSLLATQVVSRIREVFQLELPIRSLFESPTVAGLAERMMRDESQAETLENIALMWKQLEVLSEAEAEAMLSEARLTAEMETQ